MSCQLAENQIHELTYTAYYISGVQNVLVKGHGLWRMQVRVWTGTHSVDKSPVHSCACQ